MAIAKETFRYKIGPLSIKGYGKGAGYGIQISWRKREVFATVESAIFIGCVLFDFHYGLKINDRRIFFFPMWWTDSRIWHRQENNQ